jgi:pimeloyl-ACP methyl ester carboxylesterase
LGSTLGRLSKREVRQVDRAVTVGPDDGYEFLRQLTVPALALRGAKDGVPDPPCIDVTIVPGGHMSPLGAPDEVLAFVRRVIALGDDPERDGDHGKGSGGVS